MQTASINLSTYLMHLAHLPIPHSQTHNIKTHALTCTPLSRVLLPQAHQSLKAPKKYAVRSVQSSPFIPAKTSRPPAQNAPVIKEYEPNANARPLHRSRLQASMKKERVVKLTLVVSTKEISSLGSYLGILVSRYLHVMHPRSLRSRYSHNTQIR